MVERRKVIIVKVVIYIMFLGRGDERIYSENGIVVVRVVCKDVSVLDYISSFHEDEVTVVGIDLHKMVRDLQVVHPEGNLRNVVKDT